MAAPSANQALVQKARDALGRLSGAPVTAPAARAASAEIDRDWAQVPLVGALEGGSAEDRAAFLDHLCGGGLLAAEALEGRGGAAAPLVRLRRGASTRLRAIRPDGSERAFSARAATASQLEAGQSALLARRDLIRAEVEARQSALEGARLALPGPLRRRPPLWAVWTWALRLVLMLVRRSRLEAVAEAEDALEESRRRLAGVEVESAGNEEETRSQRERFAERVQAALGGRDGAEWAELHLELGQGPLEEGVEIVLGLGRGGPAEDAVLVMHRGEVLARASGAGAGSRRLGGPVEAAEALAGFLADARALRLAARARGELAAGASVLDHAIERAEEGFRARIERLERMAVADREAFTAAQVERVRPLVIERGTLVLQQATGHFEAALDRLVSAWVEAVSRATSGDELRAAAGRIDDEAPAAVEAIAREVQRLIASALSGGAHDLEPELVEELVRRGLPQVAGGRGEAPVPRAMVEVASSMAGGLAGKVSGAAPRLQGLFRSLDARRSDVLERIEQRRTRLRELGVSELLGAEPRVRDALISALTVVLGAALDRHAAWLEQALEAERAAIEQERVALEPLARARDAARRDERDLRERMAQLEASYPPV